MCLAHLDIPTLLQKVRTLIIKTFLITCACVLHCFCAANYERLGGNPLSSPSQNSRRQMSVIWCERLRCPAHRRRDLHTERHGGGSSLIPSSAFSHKGPGSKNTFSFLPSLPTPSLSLQAVKVAFLSRDQSMSLV